MAPVGLKHWMLHNDQLASEYDETLKLSPGYDPVRAVDPALTFCAPLLTGPDSIPGAIRATFERNSEATYQAPRGAFLLAAGDDKSRHEYTPQDEPLGVLMEPAVTNKCENYNADADDALTNMRTADIADGVLSAVKDEESLARSGLSSIVGKVFFLDNRGNGLASFVQAFGECDNLNPHSAHLYMHVLQGTGALGIRFDQSDVIELEANDRYEKLALANVIPDSVNNRISIKANSDSAVYFILNQLEEAKVTSSVIVTEGAATSRAVDQLSWPLAGALTPILNEAEGMAATIWRPGFSKSDTVPTVVKSILGLTEQNASWIHYVHGGTGNTVLEIKDGTSFPFVTLDNNNGPEKDTDYLIMARWNSVSPSLQIGYKKGGIVTWGTAAAYDGTFINDGFLRLFFNPQLPGHGRHAHLWNKDRGTDWLETFFSEVAN